MSNRSGAAGSARPAPAPTASLATSGSEAAGGQSGGVQSVDRAISVLEILARGGAGVSEVAAQIGVHKSTAFRLLNALESRGLVEQPENRGKYELGFGLLSLASSVPARLNLVQQARDTCEQLASDVGETVNLAVIRSHFAVNLHQARGPAAVSAHNWVGELTPLHATSSGKVLLAYLATPTRTALLDAAGLERFTERTICSRRTLETQLSASRRAGFATTFEEYEVALNAIAAPVRDHTGGVLAAVSVAGPSFRFGRRRIKDVTARLIDAAQEISARMGYRPAL